MKKSRIIVLVIAGGVFGFGVHLVWHSSTGVNLFSFGPHAIQGTLFTLAGMTIGGVLHLIIPKR